MKTLLFILGVAILFFILSIATAIGVIVGMDAFFTKKGAENGRKETNKTT